MSISGERFAFIIILAICIVILIDFIKIRKTKKIKLKNTEEMGQGWNTHDITKIERTRKLPQKKDRGGRVTVENDRIQKLRIQRKLDEKWLKERRKKQQKQKIILQNTQSWKEQHEKYLESIQDDLLESELMEVPKGKKHIPDSRRVSSEVRQKVWKRDKGKCVDCGSKENLHYDHIIPLSKGGGNSVENIQILCQICNLIKSDKIE